MNRDAPPESLTRLFWGRVTTWQLIMATFVGLLNWEYVEAAWQTL